jgi:hypothetical protein
MPPLRADERALPTLQVPFPTAESWRLEIVQVSKKSRQAIFCL